MSKALPRLARRLIAWQRQSGRHDLPWQNTLDPYRVWLSEIMLQQTQVVTVIDYFNRFVARFPDVHALAQAPIDDVLAHWAGLGYYARARNLHACAQHIVQVYGGIFPETAQALQTLPGIGPSTAAAVAAFCFAERTPILDGNVKRVYCRFFGVTGDPTSRKVSEQLWQLAQQETPDLSLTLEQPDAMARFTQGLMDLGATCCTRRRPACERCPIADHCVAHLSNRTDELPNAKVRKKIPERSTTMLLITAHLPCQTIHSQRFEKAFLLIKRPHQGIWGGLWSLPECGRPMQSNPVDKSMMPHNIESNVHDWCVQHGMPNAKRVSLAGIKHTFTHFHLHIQPWLIELDGLSETLNVAQLASDHNLQWVRTSELKAFGMPAPIQSLVSEFAMLGNTH